jgi:hypothetical protein
MHQIVAERLGVDENLPCADSALLVPLKRSKEYRAIRKRVADLHPADSWQQEGFHFFVFVLHAADGTNGVLLESPVVVFAMHPEEKDPVSAVVVTPTGDGAEAEIRSLRDPDSAYTAPISS